MKVSSTITRRAFVGGLSAGLVACAAPRQSWGKTRADVIIIGAGLAGLHAARLIEVAGYRPLIIEGSGRSGGRLYTLDDIDGQPEAGGVQVGAGYRRFHAIADRLNVERYVPADSPRGSLYNINGTSLVASEWPQAPQNKLSRDEKSTLPDALFFRYLKDLPALENPDDWMLPKARSLDIPLRKFLTSAGASDEAQRLIAANLNGNSLDIQSALHMARTLAIYRQGSGPVQYVRGGSQRMTDAMASELRSDIRLNSEVTALAEDATGVDVTLSDGRILRAAQCICTAPFSVVRKMNIISDMPAVMRRTIAEIPYTRASFAYIRAKTTFWKKDGFAETIWSDDPLLGRVFILGEEPPMLKAWLNGPSADLLDKMPVQDAGRAILERIENARASARGQLEVVDIYSWQKNKYANGIYHHIGAGQGAVLAAAAQHEGARLHYAGEHLAQDTSGMEGALESGERAANLVLKRLS